MLSVLSKCLSPTLNLFRLVGVTCRYIYEYGDVCVWLRDANNAANSPDRDLNILNYVQIRLIFR